MRHAALLLPIALGLATACQHDTSAPAPVNVPLDQVLGTWSFQVQDNVTCSGAAHIGTITVQVNQTAQDVFLATLVLNHATSTWSQGLHSGYVTGLLNLYLPIHALLSLAEGFPVNGAQPTNVATLEGAIAPNLTFVGTLTDPNTPYKPIFSTSPCIYQVTGHHE